MDVYFLVEEPSMEAVLNIILPRILIDKTFQVFPHQGKSDLQKSIVKRIRNLSHSFPDAKFVVLQDKDSSDCRLLKAQLLALCSEAGVENALVRIVCHELENWLLADMEAIERAFELSGFTSKYQNRAKYRVIDSIANSAEEISKLVRGYPRKVTGAAKVATHMNINRNRS